jgi:hypothetical protein
MPLTDGVGVVLLMMLLVPVMGDTQACGYHADGQTWRLTMVWWWWGVSSAALRAVLLAIRLR